MYCGESVESVATVMASAPALLTLVYTGADPRYRVYAVNRSAGVPRLQAESNR
jgi:hypothetical protein